MAELTFEELRKRDLEERGLKREKKKGKWLKEVEVEVPLRSELERVYPTHSGSSRFNKKTPPFTSTIGRATGSMARGLKPSEA